MNRIELMRYMISHHVNDVQPDPINEDMIIAEHVYTQRSVLDGKSVVTCHVEMVKVKATLKDVRDWLGY